MKIILGFVLGIMVASAVAQGGMIGELRKIDAHLNAGVGPDSRMAPIRVDSDGYVICSDQRKP